MVYQVGRSLGATANVHTVISAKSARSDSISSDNGRLAMRGNCGMDCVPASTLFGRCVRVMFMVLWPLRYWVFWNCYGAGVFHGPLSLFLWLQCRATDGDGGHRRPIFPIQSMQHRRVSRCRLYSVELAGRIASVGERKIQHPGQLAPVCRQHRPACRGRAGYL